MKKLFILTISALVFISASISAAACNGSNKDRHASTNTKVPAKSNLSTVTAQSKTK